MKSTKPTSNEAENGNKSKPLLCDVFSHEDLIVKINKNHLIILYDFAFKLAKKAGKKKLAKLKEIDVLINSKSYE